MSLDTQKLTFYCHNQHPAASQQCQAEKQGCLNSVLASARRPEQSAGQKFQQPAPPVCKEWAQQRNECRSLLMLKPPLRPLCNVFLLRDNYLILLEWGTGILELHQEHSLLLRQAVLSGRQRSIKNCFSLRTAG